MSSKRVLILDSSNSIILNSSLNDLEKFNLVKLKHPKSNEPNYFLLIETINKEYDLFELINFNVDLGSLFIDNYVQSDCLIYLASKFNIDYFLLYLLYNQTNDAYTPLDELKQKLLEMNSIEKSTWLADALASKLNATATHNYESLFDVEDKTKLRYNQVKCMKWLKEKFNAVRLYLESQRVQASSELKTKVKSEPDDEKVKYEAFELVSQYLDKSLADKFRKELNLVNPLDDNGNNKNKRSKGQEITNN